MCYRDFCLRSCGGISPVPATEDMTEQVGQKDGQLYAKKSGVQSVNGYSSPSVVLDADDIMVQNAQSVADNLIRIDGRIDDVIDDAENNVKWETVMISRARYLDWFIGLGATTAARLTAMANIFAKKRLVPEDARMYEFVGYGLSGGTKNAYIFQNKGTGAATIGSETISLKTSYIIIVDTQDTYDEDEYPELYEYSAPDITLTLEE